VPTLREAEADLLAPSGPFALAEETVLGERMQVFARRVPHLRSYLESSVGFGDAEYLVADDTRLTFAEHARLVASTAAALRKRFGVGKGDRVAILAANRPEWIITFWAATSLGAVAVGLNGWWTRDEILYGLEDCDPKLLVGDSKRLARLSGAALAVPVVEMESEFRALSRFDLDAPLPATPIAEDDPACILYTSGTTGRPKGAVNTHRNIVALAGLQFFHGLRLMLASGSMPAGPSCALISSPLFHVSGLYTGAVTTLAGGVKTVWTSRRFDPLEVLETIVRERVTSWSPMGTMAHRLVHHRRVGDFDLGHVRNVGSGGAPMSPELQQKLRQVFPAAADSFGLGYGLTESTALATLNFGEDLVRHPRSVGRALPTVAVEIRDDDGHAIGEGEEGEIYLRSPLVMLGYWRKPAETSAVIGKGRWLRTGDWGHVIDGMLTLDSRKRDMILRGAENVYPIEIELRLEAHPAVREAAVIGVAHEELGQEVKAIVVVEASGVVDAAELRRWAAETLAYYKVPAHWEIRHDPLPRNATGKVLKEVLKGDPSSAFVESD
jgi:acyl-CoA synthetase (AMP-forming)/AMP-acid ligase II